jgi:hypothetical protein
MAGLSAYEPDSFRIGCKYGREKAINYEDVKTVCSNRQGCQH